LIFLASSPISCYNEHFESQYEPNKTREHKPAGASIVSAMSQKPNDEKYMRMALEEAEEAGFRGEVPVGAVLVKEDRVLARDHNRCIELNDPTAHAEVLVLRKGGGITKNYRLYDTAIYVTTEPCPMCASAMVHSRITRLVFGAWEPKFGAVESKFRLLEDGVLNHRVVVCQGVLEKECAEILKAFFEKRRLESRNGN
jgi:tRNA(adenine34) deaminase